MAERNGGLMEDLISRQEAIDALDKIFPADPMRNNYTQGITCGAALATEYIKQLPSAHPETHDKRTETHACDCISRQAAIDALDKRFDSIPMEQTTEILLLRKDLRALPSAQPETHEERTETHTCDLISRQAAIDKLETVGYDFSNSGLSEIELEEVCEAVGNVRQDMISMIKRLPSAQPFHNIMMNDVLKYIDYMPEDVWQEFTACLECRGWELQRRTAKWCGSEFA